MTHNFDKKMQKKLEFERINDFFSKTKGVYAGTTFNVVITSQLIAPFATVKAITIWVISIIVCYIPRIVMTVLFFRSKRAQKLSIDNIQQWEDRTFLYSILPFLAISSIAFMPFEGGIRAGFVVAALSLMSLLVGGVIIYNSSKKVISLYLYICLGCLIVRCLFEGSYYFYTLAVYFLVILVFVRKLVIRQYSLFIEHIETRLQFEKESLTDPLTGLPNRRRLQIFMEKFMPASQRTGHEFQIVMIDIDHFKNYNDAHGHILGDKLLRDFARLVKKKIRSSDLFVRYGGEEFALILTANSPEISLPFLAELMLNIEKKLGITVSAGIASSKMSEDFKQLLKLADGALYQSKQQGRNQITIAKVD